MISEKNVVIQTILSLSEDKVILLDSSHLAESIAEVMRYDEDFRLAIAQGVNIYSKKYINGNN